METTTINRAGLDAAFATAAAFGGAAAASPTPIRLRAGFAADRDPRASRPPG